MRSKEGEHPWGDAGQVVLLGLFLVVWIGDSFFWRRTTFLAGVVPLAARLAGLVLALAAATLLVRSGHTVVDHGHESEGVVSSGAPAQVLQLRVRLLPGRTHGRARRGAPRLLPARGGGAPGRDAGAGGPGAGRRDRLPRVRARRRADAGRAPRAGDRGLASSRRPRRGALERVPRWPRRRPVRSPPRRLGIPQGRCRPRRRLAPAQPAARPPAPRRPAPGRAAALPALRGHARDGDSPRRRSQRRRGSHRRPGTVPRSARADLLAITAVHPMREDAVADLLARAGERWPVVEELLADGRLARREHGGRTFFVRRFARPASPATAGATPRRVS